MVGDGVYQRFRVGYQRPRHMYRRSPIGYRRSTSIYQRIGTFSIPHFDKHSSISFSSIQYFLPLFVP